MPTRVLTMGIMQVMTQNEIFALPAVKCTMMTDLPAATYAQSPGAATFVAIVPAANGQMDVSGGFIVCTTASPNVMLRRA